MKKNGISTVIAMNSIMMVLGMVLLTQFYAFLFKGVFTTAGWLKYFQGLGQYIPAHSFRHLLIVFFKQTAPFSTYVFAAGLFMSAWACLALFTRFYLGLFFEQLSEDYCAGYGMPMGRTRFYLVTSASSGKID